MKAHCSSACIFFKISILDEDGFLVVLLLKIAFSIYKTLDKNALTNYSLQHSLTNTHNKEYQVIGSQIKQNAKSPFSLRIKSNKLIKEAFLVSSFSLKNLTFTNNNNNCFVLDRCTAHPFFPSLPFELLTQEIKLTWFLFGIKFLPFTTLFASLFTNVTLCLT